LIMTSDSGFSIQSGGPGLSGMFDAETPFRTIAAGRSATTGQADQSQDIERQTQLTRLRERDREVRDHEQAHVAAGGQHVRGGMQLELQKGPDGNVYAVGGSVNLDTAPVPGDPESTVEKARTVRRAALAPAEPSGQDRNVAAEASAMEAQARLELQTQTSRELGQNNQGPAELDPETAARSKPGARSTLTQRAVAGYTNQDFPPPGSGFNATA
jgi:hypothetical protein